VPELVPEPVRAKVLGPEQVLVLVPELAQVPAQVPEPVRAQVLERAQALVREQALVPEQVLALVPEQAPALVQARSGGFSFSTHRAWLERPGLHCARHCNRVPNGQQRMQGRLHHRSS